MEVGIGLSSRTDRENVFLNGAILGMTRRETEQAFNEIVSFAEVEEFIDTPLKRYSSGMYLRLAFPVSGTLAGPEILIVDEVLAVGDASISAEVPWRRWAKQRARARRRCSSVTTCPSYGLCVIVALFWIQRSRWYMRGVPWTR